MNDIIETVEYAIAHEHIGAIYMFTPRLIEELKKARRNKRYLELVLLAHSGCKLKGKELIEFNKLSKEFL